MTISSESKYFARRDSEKTRTGWNRNEKPNRIEKIRIEYNSIQIVGQQHIIIKKKIKIIIIIISIFKEDNVFSIIASLPYGPPMNTDIDYYQTFFRTFIFCKCCNVSCAIFVRRREASACLIMLSTKQGSHWNHF